MLYEDGTISDIGEIINLILPLQMKLKEESTCGDIVLAFLGIHHLNFLYGSKTIKMVALKGYSYIKLLTEMHNSLINYYSPNYSRKEIEKDWLEFYTSNILQEKTENILYSLYRSLPLLNAFLIEKEKLSDIVRYVHSLFLEMLRRYQDKKVNLPVEVIAFSIYPIINFELFLEEKYRRELLGELDKYKGTIDKIFEDLYLIYCQKRYPRFILDAVIIGISTVYLRLGWVLEDKKILLLKVVESFLGENGGFLYELNPMLYFDTISNILFLFLNFVEMVQDRYLGAMILEDLKVIVDKVSRIPEEWLNDISYYKFENLLRLYSKKKEELIEGFHKES